MNQGSGYRMPHEIAHYVPASFGSSGTVRLGNGPARRPPSGGVFGLVLVAVLGLVVGFLHLTVPLETTEPPSRTGGSPTAGSTSRPSSSATAATDYPNNVLKSSELYDLTLSGTCPQVRVASSRAAYQTQVDGLLTCLATIYEPLIDRAGGTFAPVKHKFYDRSVDSSCGRSTDAYAFYCEGDATIYFSSQVYRDRDYARLLVADVVIHEYGHHVQAMMGMFEAGEHTNDSESVQTRRHELQTFCWTYYTFATIPSFALTVDDHNYFRETWDNTDDAEGHGSVKAQQYWGDRGLSGRNLGACNTWSVSESRVR